MTKPAYDKIAGGLTEAIAFAEGDASKGRVAAPRLTSAQRRALLWLPADGRWQAHVKSAETSRPRRDTLWTVCQIRLVEKTFVDFFRHYRLTPAGQAARAQIEKEGA